MLIEGAEGKRKISAVQATIGLGLMKKVLPDISQVQLSGDDESPVQLAHRIERVIVRAKN